MSSSPTTPPHLCSIGFSSETLTDAVTTTAAATTTQPDGQLGPVGQPPQTVGDSGPTEYTYTTTDVDGPLPSFLPSRVYLRLLPLRQHHRRSRYVHSNVCPYRRQPRSHCSPRHRTRLFLLEKVDWNQHRRCHQCCTPSTLVPADKMAWCRCRCLCGRNRWCMARVGMIAHCNNALLIFGPFSIYFWPVAGSAVSLVFVEVWHCSSHI